MRAAARMAGLHWPFLAHLGLPGRTPESFRDVPSPTTCLITSTTQTSQPSKGSDSSQAITEASDEAERFRKPRDQKPGPGGSCLPRDPPGAS